MINEKKYDAVVKLNTVSLDIKKTLDGNIIIYDHPKILIIVSWKNNKIITLPKFDSDEDVYNMEKRYFDFLEERGLIELGSVQGGAMYASIEATIPDSEEMKAVETIIQSTAEFLKDEKEMLSNIDNYKDEVEDWMLDPSDEDSTELGEVPHRAKKGSIPSRPFGKYGGFYGYYY